MLITASVIVGLAGCQTETKTISLEQAKTIGAEFSAAGYVAPKRTIDDVLSRYKYKLQRICYEKSSSSLAERRQQIRYSFENKPKLINWSSSNRVAFARDSAREAYMRGNIHNAITYMEWAQQGLFASSKSSWTGNASVFSHLTSTYLAFAGDLDGAQSALSSGDSDAKPWNRNYLQSSTISTAYRAKANVARAEGELSSAIGYYSLALQHGDIAIEQVRADRQQRDFNFHTQTDQIMITVEMAEALMAQGKAVEAEARLRNAILGFKYGSAFWMSRISALGALSGTLYAQGRYEDAIKLAKAVTGGFEGDCSSGSLGAASVMVIHAKSLLALGDFEGALNILNKLKKNFEGDKERLELKFGDDLEWALAELLGGNFDEAENRLNKALDLTRSRLGEGSFKESLISGGLGLVKLKKGDTVSARSLLKQSAEALLNDQNSANTWVRAIILEGYLTLLNSSGETADTSEAFRVSQGLQSSSVQRALAQNSARAGVNDPELAQLIRDQQDLVQQIDVLQSTLAAALTSPDKKAVGTVTRIQKTLPTLRAQRDTLKQDIASKFPRYDNLINPKPLSVTDVQTSIPSGQSLLVIRTLKDKTFVWAVPKSGAVSFTAVDLGTTKLTEIIDDLRSAVDPGPLGSLGDIPAFDLASAHKLYETLLKPVEAGWKGSKTINLVAQGPIGQLPLSMLPVKRASVGTSDLLFAEYQDVPWLANSHAVAMLPSVGALTSFSRTGTTANRQPFVGFGDPYFSHSQAMDASKEAPIQLADASNVRGAPVQLRSSPQTRAVNSADLGLLPRLPATGFELTSIATNMGADPKTSVFLGKAANEKQVKEMKLDTVDVLAFATHGLVPGDLNGLDQPALALSAPKVAGVDGDGLLTMGEILTLKLNADWVVLSACNTASADGAGAEAVSGLGRAFFYAGARSLLVSNWPVHSGATAKLTTTLFYLQANDGSMERAEALQKTRIQMIKTGTQKDKSGKPLFSYAHPIFWAPFTIVGDGGGSTAGS
jgi:CHAT domain-containing protein/tetratricopeptide (TPR) repeat protein